MITEIFNTNGSNNIVPTVIPAASEEYYEEIIPVTKFSLYKKIIDKQCNYRLGVLTVYGKKVGIINEVFVNKNHYKDYVDNRNTIIFLAENAEIENTTEDRINTSKNVYIVCYVPGGTIVNQKTGNIQPTIDYNYPVIVLKSNKRKNVVLIATDDNNVLTRSLNRNEATPKLEKKLSEDIIKIIREKLDFCVGVDGFITPSIFPRFVKECGILNYKLFANSVEDFIEKFIPDYQLIKNVSINGKTYPGIIVSKITGIKFKVGNNGNDTTQLVIKDNYEQECIKTLLQLYEKKKYLTLLTSTLLKTINFCDLPYNVMEMCLTSAQRLIYGESAGPVVLNLFQKELINANTTVDFIKKWKTSTTGFHLEILKEYANSCIADIRTPNDYGILVTLIRHLGYSNSKNDNYAGLVDRFSTCYDEILPYLHFIRLCVQNSQTMIIKVLSEYCYTLKGIKHSLVNTRLNPDKRMYGFTDFLKAFRLYLMNDFQINHTSLTLITSVYIEKGDIADLREVLLLFDPDNSSAEYKLLELFDHSNGWTERQIIELIEEKVSIQLLQRSVALIWEEYRLSIQLPQNFLHLLCWICVNDSFLSLDEILRFHYSSNFTKKQKEIQLIESYQEIIKCVRSDIKMYALASYIAIVVFQNVGEENVSSELKELLLEWPSESKDIIKLTLHSVENISIEKESSFVELFKVFSMDEIGYLMLQKRYASWYLEEASFSFNIDDKYQTILDNLYEIGAYEAYASVFELIKEKMNIEEGLSPRIAQYVDALCALRRYSNAILFIQQSDSINNEMRSHLLIEVITHNFRNNGLTTRAFSLFESYECDEAIRLLLDHFNPNQYVIVTDLIALYVYKKEYIKALYLYVIYKSKSENGFTRLYSQFRGIIKSFGGAINNHYDVIEFAFFVLTPNDIIEFFLWITKIPIPEFKDYKPKHSFAYYYGTLKKDVHNVNSWTVFLTHLTKRMDLNSWMVVVCETILKQVFNIVITSNTKIALNSLMSKDTIDELPYNFLPYAFSYIIQSGDSLINNNLLTLLKKEGCKERLIINNIFYDSYKRINDEFQQHLIKEYRATGDELYYQLLSHAGMELDASDLKLIAQLSSEKSLVFARLSTNYLYGKEILESVSILKSMEGTDLSLRDAEVLNLLKIIYDEDEVLLLSEGILFLDEESVRRFKYDCAKIISYYPQKDGVYMFDSSCIDTVHKLIVLSFILGSLYDEGLYDKYSFLFSDIFYEKRLYFAYLAFLRKAFYAQLEWNLTYDFFYKKWRYLKLYLANILLNEGIFDDSQIIVVMSQFDHYDFVFEESYVPFRKTVNTFWNLQEIEDVKKKEFLFLLMEGQLGDFLRKYSRDISSLSEEGKFLIKELISHLDYREVSYNFFRMYISEIEENKYEEALAVASGLSQSIYDALLAVEKLKDERLITILKEIALEEKPAKVVNKSINVKEEDFTKYSSVIIPIVCSRQFDFHIYGTLRRNIISGRNKVPSKYLDELEKYLKYLGREQISTIRAYLCVLQAAINQDRPQVNEVISKNNIREGIPAQWEREAESLYGYASGKIKQFTPERTFIDNSQISTFKHVSFTFIESLAKTFNVKKRRLPIKEVIEIYENYINESQSMWERVASGTTLLINYPRFEKGQRESLSIPKKNELVLMVGMDALAPELNLPIDKQMLILVELYNSRYSFDIAENNVLVKRLCEIFKNILNRFLPIDIWIRYSDSISSFISENHLSSDFQDLNGVQLFL